MSLTFHATMSSTALPVVGSTRGLEASLVKKSMVSDVDDFSKGPEFADILSKDAPAEAVPKVETIPSPENEPSNVEQNSATEIPVSDAAAPSGNDVTTYAATTYYFVPGQDSNREFFSKSNCPALPQSDGGSTNRGVKPFSMQNDLTELPAFERSQLTNLRVETQHRSTLSISDWVGAKGSIDSSQSDSMPLLKIPVAGGLACTTSTGSDAFRPSQEAEAMSAALVMPGSIKVDRRGLSEGGGNFTTSRGPEARARVDRPVATSDAASQVIVEQDSVAMTEQGSIRVAKPSASGRDGGVGGSDDQWVKLKDDASPDAHLLSAFTVMAIRNALEATLGNIGKDNSFTTVESLNATLSADQALQAPLKILQFALTHDGGGTVKLKLSIVDGSLSISISTDNAKLGHHLNDERPRLESDLQHSGYAVREVLIETLPTLSVDTLQQGPHRVLESQEFYQSDSANAGQGRGGQSELGGSRQQRNQKSLAEGEQAPALAEATNVARTGQYV